MATLNLWKNVAVAMQSAIGTGIAISGVTKASPAVVTTGSAHSYSNGDFVYVTANGMWQINGRVFRITAASGSTLTLEGQDSTLFDTFTSGYVYKLTYGTSITTALDWQGSGGGFSYIDATTIHGNQRVQTPGLPEPVSYTFNNIWDPSDAAQVAMKAASDTQAQRAFKITFSTGAIVVFSGFVGFSATPGGSAQDKVTSQATISAYGPLTQYSS